MKQEKIEENIVVSLAQQRETTEEKIDMVPLSHVSTAEESLSDTEKPIAIIRAREDIKLSYGYRGSGMQTQRAAYLPLLGTTS